MLRLLMTLGTALLLAGSARAQIHVPGDFADLQDAIDAASPGAVIVVHGGTFASIAIDKPLTIHGNPAPFLTSEPDFSGYPPVIRLDGSGSGEVVLSNIRTGGIAFGNIFSFTGAGIEGGGFAELHVYDSEIAALDWCCLSGLGVGKPAIDVDVPFVLVERSTVRASNTAIDSSAIVTSAWPGPPGIDAPASTVVTLDSDVRGGDSGEYNHPSSECGGGPCPGGVGGDGVIADELYIADSSLVGGFGALWFDPIGLVCCGGGQGEAFLANTVTSLAGDLDAERPPRMGSDYELHLASPGPSAVLYAAEAIGSPSTMPEGLLFLGGTPLALGSFPTPSTVELPIPLDVGLFGREIAFQLLDPVTGWSRPVAGILLLPLLPRLAPHAAPTATRSF